MRLISQRTAALKSVASYLHLHAIKTRTAEDSYSAHSIRKEYRIQLDRDQTDSDGWTAECYAAEEEERAAFEEFLTLPLDSPAAQNAKAEWLKLRARKQVLVTDAILARRKASRKPR